MQLAPCLNGESYHALYLKIMEIKTPWYIQSLTETYRQPINVRKKRSLLKCSLKYCVECKKEVSTTAKTCPNCGNPEPTLTGKAKQNKKDEYIGIIILLILEVQFLKVVVLYNGWFFF